VDNPSFLVKISNSMSNLEDYMTGKILAEISELDDLME
jgi:hypothetical protein